MGGVSRTLTSEYDPGGRRTRLTFPDSVYFTYEYDAAGRLTTIRENGATAVASFTYDSLGRRADASRTGTSTTYGYDPLSRLASLDHDLTGTAADQSLTFGYNPASQIVTRSFTNAAYDSSTIANASRSYGVNGLNQYTSVGGSAHAYDLNGNLSSDGATTFRYDAENRLVAATGATPATLVYDPRGRLFQTSGGAPGTTQFLYDGDSLVAEYNASGTLLRRYVHGSGVDEPVLWYEGAGLGSPRGLLADHQGSVAAVSDGNGNSLSINGYDVWGVPNPGNLGRFQYTGQAWLPELGLYHYKARVYSPTLGRFLQTDPVGYEDQVNLYAYVRNDPINSIDPSGKAALLLPAIPWVTTALEGILIGLGVVVVADQASEAYNALNESSDNSPRPSDGLPVQEGATVERPGKTGSRDQIYGKPGTVDDANRDFDSSAVSDTVEDKGDGVRTGQTERGDNITVRPGSSSGEPTVEVTRGNGKHRDTDKFRYRPPPSLEGNPQ